MEVGGNENALRRGGVWSEEERVWSEEERSIEGGRNGYGGRRSIEG